MSGELFRFSLSGLIFASVLLSGCTTTRNQLFLEADGAIETGDYETALNILEDQNEVIYSGRDNVLYFLDTGMLHYYAGNYD
ncbi:MAG: hypothetical protein ACOCZ9_04065, partial [Spirochaetota bacterium]